MRPLRLFLHFRDMASTWEQVIKEVGLGQTSRTFGDIEIIIVVDVTLYIGSSNLAQQFLEEEPELKLE